MKPSKAITSAGKLLARLLVEQGRLHPELADDVNQILVAAYVALKEGEARPGPGESGTPRR